MISQPSLFPAPTKLDLDSDSDQRYTPQKWIDRVIQILGEIDLDPTADPTLRVPAKYHITEQIDCLTTDWVSHCGGVIPETIYMNMPYSNAHPFIQRLCEYLDENPGAIAITLTHSSLCQTLTSQPYFRLYSRAICLPNQRINFDYPEGAERKSSNDRDSLISYWGNARLLPRFKEVFKFCGWVLNV